MRVQEKSGRRKERGTLTTSRYRQLERHLVKLGLYSIYLTVIPPLCGPTLDLSLFLSTSPSRNLLVKRKERISYYNISTCDGM